MVRSFRPDHRNQRSTRARQSQSPDRAAVTSRRCEDGVGRRGDSRRGAPCPSIGVPRAVRAGGGRRRHHAQVRQRVPQRRRCALPFGSRHAGRRCGRVVDPARRGRGSRRRQGAPLPMTVKGSVLELIGNTPMVDISELSPNPDVRILIKLEGQNPGGSVKDRIALSMIEEAEKDGVLKPGQTLIEPSSGNTGIGMALICQVKGYHLKVVLATNVSIERRQLLEVWGAEIIESPGAEGSNGAVKRARALAADHPEWVFLYQYANPANPKAHYEGTGPEIWRDCPEVTHFVAGLGTSGTLLGAGRFLKEQNPDVKVWAIEPPAGELVDGLRNLDDGYVPPIFTDNNGVDLLDGKRIVRPRESIEWTRRLIEVGIFAGISSGAALAGAAKTAARIESGTIVVIAADGGWKYLSTGAWTDELHIVEERARRITYF